MAIDEITGIDVLEELEERRVYWNPLRKEQKRCNKFFELDYESGIPEQDLFKQRLPATAREWVMVGVRNYTLDNPLVRMVPRGIEKKDREADGAVEALANFFMHLYSAEIKNTCKKALLRGEAFMRIDMDDTYFGMDEGLTKSQQKIFESKRLRTFPIQFHTVDPLNCYPSSSESQGIPDDVIEEYEITYAKAKSICKKNGWAWTPVNVYSSTSLVKWVSFISADRKIYFIDGIEVLNTVNLFGFVPYYHVDAGMGQSSFEGNTAHMYKSILFPQLDSLKMEARAYTFADAMLSRIAFRQVLIMGEQVEVDKLYPKNKIPTDPDIAMRGIKDRVEVSMMESGEIPASVFEMLGMLAQKASAPAVLSGGSIPGVYSAQHRENIMATALPVYKDTLKAVQKGLAAMVSMALKILEEIYKHDVQVKDFSSKDAKVVVVKPSTIAGNYDCDLQLLAEPPEATDMRKSLGSQLKAAGDISDLHNLMKYHNMTLKEAMGEIIQKAAERALLVIDQAIGMDALAQMGLESEVQQVEEAQQQMQQPGKPQQEATGYDGATKRGRQSTQEGSPDAPGIVSATPGEQ